MYTGFIIIGLLLSSGTSGILHRQNGGVQMSGDGSFDIDNGSGIGPTLLDDEDAEEISGESSGSGQTSTNTQDFSTVPTTTRSLTACEQLRLSTQNTTTDAYKPKCTLNGEYEPLQCHRRMYNKECWCVDKFGNEITGSKMMQPNVPDCITGNGLKPCVYQLLKKKQGLLGVYHPRCTIDGEFEKIQCLGSACWCVDEVGVEQQDTKVYQPEVPSCREPTTKPKVETTTRPDPSVADTTQEPQKTTTVTKNDKNDNNIYITKTEDNDDKSESTDIIIPGIGDWENEDSSKDKNQHTEENSGIGKTEKQDSSPIVYIMGRPGLLAAVIGGAVVTLLLTILLVMFIVYRMRKKDEGSYPLDEQKYTNYSYMKAPDKEFYA